MLKTCCDFCSLINGIVYYFYILQMPDRSNHNIYFHLT